MRTRILNLASSLNISSFDLQQTLDSCSFVLSNSSDVPVIFTTPHQERVQIEMGLSIHTVLADIITPLIQPASGSQHNPLILGAHVRLLVRQSRSGITQLVIRCLWLLEKTESEHGRCSSLNAHLIAEGREHWQWRATNNPKIQVARRLIPINNVRRYPKTLPPAPECQLNIGETTLRWLTKSRLATLGAKFTPDANLLLADTTAASPQTTVGTNITFAYGVGINPCWTTRQLLATLRFSKPSMANPTKLENELHGNENISMVNNSKTPATEQIDFDGLPILNTASIQQLVDDVGAESLPIILEAFIAELEIQIKTLAEPLCEANYATLARTVHTLKSSAGTLGASALQSAAGVADSLMKDQNNDLPADTLKDVLSLARLTLTHFKHFSADGVAGQETE